MKKLHNGARLAVLSLSVLTCTTAAAQVEGSALDYMLQHPSVAKSFGSKSFGDHLFLDAGASLNAMGSKDLKFGAATEAHVGDWVTPEHGWRVGLSTGVYNTRGVKAKFADFSIDYLMNISAIAHRTYDEPKRFEVYGVAGVDLAYSRNDGHSERGLGFHLGLRGQYALSPYTYAYVEPRMSLLPDGISQVETWHNRRPAAQVAVGLGYRLAPWAGYPRLHTDTVSHRAWNDGLFVSLAAGPSFILTRAKSEWADHAGAKAAVSVGKWFTPIHGLRLTGDVAYYKQAEATKVKAIGAQLEYMVNLHNVFGGIDPSRRWWVNGLVGGSINSSTMDQGHETSYGLSLALQGNVKLSRSVDLFLEPRVDAMSEDYAAATTTVGSWDVLPSLLLGVSYTYHTARPLPDAESFAAPFVQKSWHDHTFVEMALGANMPIIRKSVSNPLNYLRPQGYVGVGKWFTAIHGARLWAQAAQTEWSDQPTQRTKHMEAGMDYLFNVSNALFGYNPERSTELSAGLGFNLSSRQEHSGLAFGLDFSVRGTWHATPLLALFVEPKLQGYGNHYLPTSLSRTDIDLIASAVAGVQFNLVGYDYAATRRVLEESGDALPMRISAAGGVGNSAKHLRDGSTYGPVGRLSFEKWYTPLSAWRVNLQGFSNKSSFGKYAVLSAGADYMTDLTAQTYGYDPDRVLTLTAYVGANLGVDYTPDDTRFAPDLHFGGQAAVRLTNVVRLFLEPQLAYRLSSRFKDVRLSRWMPQLLLGLDYTLQRNGRLADVPRSERSHFVSLGVGTGVFTGNFTSIHPAGRKLTMVGEVGYGQWLTAVHGWQAALSNTVAQRRGSGSENITSIKANYAMNLRTALTGEASETKLLQLTGFAGVSANISSLKGRSARVAPGLQAALQVGFRLSPSFDLYLQPEAAVFSKTIGGEHNQHPADGELRLTLGTRYNF